MLAEALCVVTFLCILLVVVALSIGPAAWRRRCFGGDGEFHFEALRYEHISRGLGGWSPQALAALRLGIAVFIVATQAYNVVIFTNVSLVTFTSWSWTLMALYFLGAGVASAMEAWKPSEEESLAFPAREMACGIWILFQVLLGIALLVFFVVWGILIPTCYAAEGWTFTRDSYLHWISLSMHNLNVVFMVLEAQVNRLTVVPCHVLFVPLYIATFVVNSWCLFLVRGTFSYFFIDWRHLSTPAWYILLLSLACLLHAGCYKGVAAWKASESELLPTSPEGLGLTSSLSGVTSGKQPQV